MNSSAPQCDLRLAAIVLTKDEERNLPDCLQSLRALAAPVVVVDSGSTDRTLEIARHFGAIVLEHPFTTHAGQWKWVLGHLPLEPQWILGLDADQRLTPEAAESIMSLVESDSAAGGAYLRRRQIFRGRWIRHGGYYPKYLLKLFRRNAVSIDERELVDHHFSVQGTTVLLNADLIEANANEDQIYVWVEKHNRYARLQAQEEIRRDGAVRQGRFFGTPDERSAWMKHIWRSMPRFVRPSLYFVYRYFFRLGFLDGKEGFVFHVLQAFWYRLLVDINLNELEERAIDERSDAEKASEAVS